MGNIASQTLGIDIATIHIPELFRVPGLCQVSIFRNPKESFASLINKHMEFSNHHDAIVEYIPHAIKKAAEQYLDYYDEISQNINNVYVLDFEKVQADPILANKEIANYFNIEYLEGREDYSYNDIQFTDHRLWSDKYDGHMPREKSQIRLLIEKEVCKIEEMSDLEQIHYEILNKSKTV